MNACWVESDRVGSFTASSLVIRHAQGDLIVDAGNSTNFDEETDVYRGRDRLFVKLFPGSLEPDAPLPELLGNAGVDPTNIHAAIMTHAHVDHIGGMMDLPAIDIWVDEAELEVLRKGGDEVSMAVVPAHARALHRRAKAIVYDDGPYEIFDRSADVFSDGTVVIVPLHGHTEGSLGVFVNLPDGRRLFHVGDAVNDRKSLRNAVDRPQFLRPVDGNRDASREMMAQLVELQRRVPELEVIPAHDRRAWKDAFGEANRACAPLPVP